MRRMVLPVAAILGTLAVFVAVYLLVNRSALPADDLDLGGRTACELLTAEDLDVLGFGAPLPDSSEVFCAWQAGPMHKAPLSVSLSPSSGYAEIEDDVTAPAIAGYPAVRHPGSQVIVAYADPGQFTVDYTGSDSVPEAAAARILANLKA